MISLNACRYTHSQTLFIHPHTDSVHLHSQYTTLFHSPYFFVLYVYTQMHTLINTHTLSLCSAHTSKLLALLCLFHHVCRLDLFLPFWLSIPHTHTCTHTQKIQHAHTFLHTLRNTLSLVFYFLKNKSEQNQPQLLKLPGLY